VATTEPLPANKQAEVAITEHFLAHEPSIVGHYRAFPSP